MADGYDRFENAGNGGGSFVMGLLTGTVLGAGLGMLFAPKAGTELRNQLSAQAGNLASQAQDGIRKVQENAPEWVERGKDIYGKAKDAVAKGADDALLAAKRSNPAWSFRSMPRQAPSRPRSPLRVGNKLDGRKSS